MKKVSKPAIPMTTRVYEAIAAHGPLAGFAVAEFLNAPRNLVFNAMKQLRDKDAIVAAPGPGVINPADRWRRRIATYTIAGPYIAGEVHPPKDFMVDDEHLAWMAEVKRKAAEKAERMRWAR